MIKNLLCCLLLLPALAFGQKKDSKTEPVRIIGPMLGYVTFNEAHVWLQTEGVVIPLIQYWDVTASNLKKYARSEQVNTLHNIYKFVCTTEAGHKYQYKVIYNVVQYKEDSLMRFTTPELWRWRKDPADFKIAFGSCHYVNDSNADRPGKPYGDNPTRIFENIADKNPNMMLWLGDNIYLREPDWGSETGIYNRYDAMRNQPAIDRLLRKCPNYAIWDDHDFGPNDANGSFAFKATTKAAFIDYWCNPTQGMPGVSGITSQFEYNDAQFFLLDNRYNRVVDPTQPEKNTILGAAQLQWLKQALLMAPSGDFKVICVGGQFLNTAAVYENYANWPKERQEILDWIKSNKIKNVVFLTGDRHHAELSMLKLTPEITVYDFTSSPLTSGVGSTKATENNTNRVEGSFYNKDRNFGILEFSGQGKDRKINFVLYDKYGSEQWRFSYNKE